MRSLSFQNLKKQFAKKAGEDHIIRDQINKILAGKFNLKEITITSRGVTLVAANKATAQELFLQRVSIQDKLKREVVIR